METLASLSRRLSVAHTIHSIVRNMKTLAAASIRQHEASVRSLEEHAKCIEQGLQIVLRGRPELPVEAASSHGETGLVIFGSSLGLAGRFNERVTLFAQQRLQAIETRKTRLLALGGFLRRRFEGLGLELEAELVMPTSVAGIAACVQDLLSYIEAWHRSHGVTEVLLCFNGRQTDAPLAPRVQCLLPLDRQWLRELRRRPWPSRCLPTHTMAWRPLFSALVREHLFISLYRAYAESLAAEQSHRLTSMQAAERNVERRVDSLQRAYHERRQIQITDELLDISSGWEVIAGQDALH